MFDTEELEPITCDNLVSSAYLNLSHIGHSQVIDVHEKRKYDQGMILVACLRSRKATVNTENLSHIHIGDGGTLLLMSDISEIAADKTTVICPMHYQHWTDYKSVCLCVSH